MGTSLRMCQKSKNGFDSTGFRTNKTAIWMAIMLLGLPAVGCATAPLNQAGSLRSYADLKPSDGMLTRSLLRVSKNDVLAAKTVRIVSTEFPVPAAGTPLTPEQRGLVANAVDRTLCAGLSERFEIVEPSQPADLTVHAVVTHVMPTDPVAAGLIARLDEDGVDEQILHARRATRGHQDSISMGAADRCALQVEESLCNDDSTAGPAAA